MPLSLATSLNSLCALTYTKGPQQPLIYWPNKGWEDKKGIVDIEKFVVQLEASVGSFNKVWLRARNIWI